MGLPDGWSLTPPDQGGTPPFADAIASIESKGSGDYSALGPVTNRGDRGYGRYQVMGANIPKWTQEVLGTPLTPEQFLADPKAQDAVFASKFGSYVQKYGSPQEAASVWFTGRPQSQGGNARDVLGTSGNQYVNKFNAALPQQASAQQPMLLAPSDAPQAPQGLPQGWSLTPPQEAPAQPSAPPSAPPAPPAPEQPYQPTPWGEIANDAANGLISGGIGGMVGTAGMGADLTRWLAQKAGYDPNGYIPSSDQIDQAVKGTIGDYSYTPTTGAGEITQAIGNMAPAAVGGGGGLARQGAQVLGTALASKAAGDAGRMVSPELGMVGDVAGAVIGGHKLAAPTVVGKAPAITAADKLAADVNMVTSPATEAIKRTSQEAYDAANAAGVQIKGSSVTKLQSALANDKALNTTSFDPKLHPAISSLVDKIHAIETSPKGPGAMSAITGYKPSPVKDISLEQFDNLRRAAVEATRSANADERRMGGAIINQLDDFFNKLTPQDVSSGNIGAAQQALSAARQNWRLYRKSEMIDKVMQSAKDDAGRLSVSGNENAIRQGFRTLSKQINRDPRTKALFTRDEVYAIRELSRGSQPRDALKNFAAAINNPLTRGAGGIGAVGMTYYSGGDPTAAALAATGYIAGKGARLASGRIALNKANQLRTLVQSGGRLARSPSVTLPIVGNVRALPLAAGLLAANKGNQ